MKKKVLIIIFTTIILLAIFLIIDYTKAPDNQISNSNNDIQENQLPNNDIKTGEEYCFIGKIVEIYSGGSLVIEPNENEEVRKSADKISVKADSDEDWEIGMEVIVTYTGVIFETYPAQVDAISVEKFPIDKLLSSYKDIKSLSKKYSIEDAIADGYFVVTYAKVYNDNLYEYFMNNVENKIQAFIRIVQPTVEGDTIITDVQYTEDGKIEICHDSTRDKFSSEEDRTYKYYTFNNIGTYKDNYGEYLYAFNGEEITKEIIENNECFCITKIN